MTMQLFGTTGEITSAVPAGLVMFYANSTVPTGFLKCNGAAVSRTTYSSLFAAIGTTYGSGDGSTTFNVPDMRGYFPRGWVDDGSVDSGRTFGSTQNDQIQGFSPVASIAYGPGLGDAMGATYYNAGGGTVPSQINWDAANPSVDSYTSAKGYVVADGTNGTPRMGSETRPDNVALLACIKY